MIIKFLYEKINERKQYKIIVKKIEAKKRSESNMKFKKNLDNLFKQMVLFQKHYLECDELLKFCWN